MNYGSVCAYCEVIEFSIAALSKHSMKSKSAVMLFELVSLNQRYGKLQQETKVTSQPGLTGQSGQQSHKS